MAAAIGLSALRIGAEPGGEGGFVDCAGCEAEDGLGGGFLRGGEAVAVQFEEEDADNEAGAFVSVDEWVVEDDPGSVSGSQGDDVGIFAVGEELPGASERGGEQAGIAQAGSAALESQKTIVEHDGVALVNPDNLLHLASTCSVLR